MIDFTLSEEQAAVRSMAAQFSSQVLTTAASEYQQYPTQNERFRATRSLFRIGVEGGVIKGLIPKPLGGTGGSLLEAAILVEEMYAVETSLSLTIFATGLGLSPLLAGGSDEQKTTFLKPFLSGEGEPLASLVHSEPSGTANWLEKGGKGLQTVARKDGDSWVVTGEKLWATNSSGWDDKGADLQCLVCREVKGDNHTQDPDSDPRDAILILLVTPEVIANNSPESYEVLGHPELAGHTAVSGPHVRFTNLRVPGKNLLAAPGKGADLVVHAFTASATLVGAMSVGIMRAAFDAALKFSKDDSRGGQDPIISRQSVADLLMDIKMRTDASRFLTWKACCALEQGLGPELSLETKIFCSDNAVKAVTDAMSAVGMSSYSKDSPFPRLMNDAMCLPLFDGGNIGVRRRQLEKIFMHKDYIPWASTYPESG